MSTGLRGAANASVPLARSYAKTNRELVAAFERYLVSRGRSPRGIRAYREPALALVDFLGARSIAEVDRGTLRQFLMKLQAKGVCANTIRLRTCALRAFFRFIRLTGLTDSDPTLQLAHRKLPERKPRVLTIEEVERIIGAARSPFERAVIEVLYGAGVRVSELVNLRLEDVRWDDVSQIHSITVHEGKGGKDRIVLFGSKAASAIRAYQQAFPSKAGFLFEVHPTNGSLCRQRPSRAWSVRFSIDGARRSLSIKTDSREEAQREFERVAPKIPGYRVLPARPYSSRAIHLAVRRVAERAKLGKIYPHALRRAFASHMLARGGDLRAIQELLGHENLHTTMLYTSLTAADLKAVHRRAHPHEQQS
jgi:site-specific recombinase XerD